MAANLERFRTELSGLIKRGDKLEFAGSRYADKAGYDRQIAEAFENDTAKIVAFNKNIPEFRKEYESWYSEGLRVIAQIIPDRLADFRSQYEVPKTRKELNHSTYTIHDMIHGLTRTNGYAELTSGLPRLTLQVNILKAAERRFESSLFDIRTVLQADLFDQEIDAARELLKHKFIRAAGALGGVVLERHLKQVVDDRKISLSKSKPTISTLNDALKDAEVIDISQWRFNQHLGDIRNMCDHAKQPDPTVAQVQDLLDGTAKVLKTIA